MTMSRESSFCLFHETMCFFSTEYWLWKRSEKANKVELRRTVSPYQTETAQGTVPKFCPLLLHPLLHHRLVNQVRLRGIRGGKRGRKAICGYNDHCGGSFASATKGNGKVTVGTILKLDSEKLRLQECQPLLSELPLLPLSFPPCLHLTVLLRLRSRIRHGETENTAKEI